MKKEINLVSLIMTSLFIIVTAFSIILAKAIWPTSPIAPWLAVPVSYLSVMALVFVFSGRSK